MNLPHLQRLLGIPIPQPAGHAPHQALFARGNAPTQPAIPSAVRAGKEMNDAMVKGKEKAQYLCREADESDLEGIAELFRSHDYGIKDPEWLRWKYFQNPAGRARVLVGEDSNGAIVALRAYMPRLFTSEKTGPFSVRQAVDWFVAKAHRGSGVYSQLREFAVARRDFPSIGFPNEISRRITKTYPGDVRVYHPVDEWWYPIRLGNPNQAPDSLAAMVSRAYAFFWLGKRSRHARMAPLERFTKDYALDPAFIHGVRTAEFLNWRFIDNPTRRFRAYEFLDGDESAGYCVYDIDRSLAKIYDLVVPRRARRCLRLLVDHLRDRGISHIIFKSVGFRMRKYGFVRIGSPGDLDTLDTPQGKWLITLADKD